MEKSQHTCLHQDKSYLRLRDVGHATTLDDIRIKKLWKGLGI